jgi:hypothetical protein
MRLSPKSLIILSFILIYCKKDNRVLQNNLNMQKNIFTDSTKLINKKSNLLTDKDINKLKSHKEDKAKLSLFPEQKPFSIMKSGDKTEKFIFYINKKNIVEIKDIPFYKVYTMMPDDDEKFSYFLGIKNENIYTAFKFEGVQGIDYFFSFNEKYKRSIGDITPYTDFYLLSLDSIYKSNNEFVYKIKFKWNKAQERLPPGEEQPDENFYLPEWDMKETYYTKKRGLIKAVIKNNKTNLTYVALPD